MSTDDSKVDNRHYLTATWPILNATVILCIVYFVMDFLRSKFKSWYKRYSYFRSLPSPKYSPLYGNMHLWPAEDEARIRMIRSMMENIHPKFTLFWMTPITPHVIVYHPDFMRAVTTSTAALKPRGVGRGYELGISWIGEGLITSNDQIWARSRKLLNPAFHSNILRNYIEVFNECADKLIEKFDEFAETGESFDVFPWITKYSLEVTMKCILGNHQADVIGCEDGKPLLWPDFMFRATSMGRSFFKRCDFVHKVADDIIEKRKKLKENGEIPESKHLDFIDILLSARSEDGQPMTPLEIRHQVDTFMFAAHDTTATALSFVLYTLAEHQAYQRKVQEEADAVLDERECEDVLWDDLSRFQMLTLCSKESMRLYAPVPILGRIVTKDIEVDDVTIPAGTVVHLGTIHMHRNPAVWDKPDEYIPERFLDEDIDKFAYVPFSAGPRNCIGQNFAKSEKTVILSRLLHRYDITLAPGYERPEREMSTVLKSKNGIWLTLKRRRNTKCT